MSRIFVISDTHFGHDIIKYCNRPFTDAQHMNEILIVNWNSVVTPQDIVYHLGDVYFSQSGKVLERLNGKKRLILGNHDDAKDPYLQKHFKKILAWRAFPEYGVVLTHMPIRFDYDFKAKKNVHGHIHQNLLMREGTKVPDDRFINVSVEHINYTPVPLEKLSVK
jgi:calcineurin-like phosphoesterase family protein